MAKPSLTPTQSDLAREDASATRFFAGAVPAIYKGKARGTTRDVAWRTNVAFWDAYDLQPEKLAPGDTAGANAWLRIEAKGTPLLYAAKSKSPAASWDPNAPTWPLPTVPKTAWKSGSVFAAKRPFYGPQTRYHTGIDLAAEAGTPDGTRGGHCGPNSGWDYDEKTGKGVKSIIMTTVSGFTVLIGGIRPGSSPLKAGQEVVAGQQIAEVGRYKGGDPWPTSIYNKLTKSKVLAQKKWS
jgi:murein DD-endopeptidase MepM/ murein hydrolase activator NlpD